MDKNNNMIDKFFSLIKVYDTEYTKVRIGRKGDGGYVVAKELAGKTDCVYSFGIGDDISFEENFYNKFKPRKIMCYDHTISGIVTDIKNIEFKKIKLEHGPRINASFLSVIGRENNLLKIDVEGDEWDYFYNIEFLNDKLREFNQIIIELHIVSVEAKEGLTPYFTKFYGHALNKINNNIFKKYCDCLQILLGLFTIIHIHGNNSLPKTKLNGHEFPPLLELTLVRNDLIEEKKLTKETFPVDGMDYPNKTDRPDFESILPFKNE